MRAVAGVRVPFSRARTTRSDRLHRPHSRRHRPRRLTPCLEDRRQQRQSRVVVLLATRRIRLAALPVTRLLLHHSRLQAEVAAAVRWSIRLDRRRPTRSHPFLEAAAAAEPEQVAVEEVIPLEAPGLAARRSGPTRLLRLKQL